jgi:hypothetical protein
MTNQPFESAVGITAHWYAQVVDFDAAQCRLTIAGIVLSGGRFAHDGVADEHRLHNTRIQRQRHLNFFRQTCFLKGRLLYVRWPNVSAPLVEPALGIPTQRLHADAGEACADARTKQAGIRFETMSAISF